MKTEVKSIAENAAVLVVGNAVVWSIQDVSTLVSIALGLVSIFWVSAQLAKFIISWWREELVRTKKPPK